MILESRARIQGPSDIYLKTGSLLVLTCVMSQGPHDLGTVAWYRDNQAVVTSPRNENDIDAEPRITVETEWSDALTSRSVVLKNNKKSKEKSLNLTRQKNIKLQRNFCFLEKKKVLYLQFICHHPSHLTLSLFNFLNL